MQCLVSNLSVVSYANCMLKTSLITVISCTSHTQKKQHCSFILISEIKHFLKISANNILKLKGGYDTNCAVIQPSLIWR